MKDLFRTSLLTSWLSRLDMRGSLPFPRKTPWYRRTWLNVPVLAWGLMAPFAVFLLWKSAALIRSGDESHTDTNN